MQHLTQMWMLFAHNIIPLILSLWLFTFDNLCYWCLWYRAFRIEILGHTGSDGLYLFVRNQQKRKNWLSNMSNDGHRGWTDEEKTSGELAEIRTLSSEWLWENDGTTLATSCLIDKCSLGSAAQTVASNSTIFTNQNILKCIATSLRDCRNHQHKSWWK